MIISIFAAAIPAAATAATADDDDNDRVRKSLLKLSQRAL